MDLLVVICASATFWVFFILQTIVFRLVDRDDVLKWIMNIFFISSVIHGLSLWFLWRFLIMEFSGSFWILLGVSYFLFGLIAFVYILCVFGPSETSIRIRVLRELDEQPRGRLSHEGLLSKYNGQIILERRIQRLLLAGEIREDSGRYILNNRPNTFFLIDAVAAFLTKVIKKS